MFRCDFSSFFYINTSNHQGSWALSENSELNSFHRLKPNSGQEIDWVIVAATFSFAETNWKFFGGVIEIVVLLKCPSLSRLHHHGNWQQMLSQYICSFNLQLYETRQCRVLKKCSPLWGSLLWYAMSYDPQIWHVLWHPYNQEFYFDLTRQYSPCISQACLNVVE